MNLNTVTNTFIAGLVAIAILITILSLLHGLIVSKYIFNDKAEGIVFSHQNSINKIYDIFFETGRKYAMVLPSNHTEEELENLKHNLIGANLGYEVRIVKIPFRGEQRMISKVF